MFSRFRTRLHRASVRPLKKQIVLLIAYDVHEQILTFFVFSLTSKMRVPQLKTTFTSFDVMCIIIAD